MNFLTKQIEKKLGVDLNGDGIIGSSHGYYPHGQGGNNLIDKLEKATHIDINGDGRIGQHTNYHQNYHYSSGYGASSQPFHFHSPNGQNNGMINELEKATNIDLNGDGRIGGQSNYTPNYQQMGGLSYPPPFNPYNAPFQPPNFNSSGGGMINELERATNIDLNGDGRIGGQSSYPPNSQQPMGPSYPLPYNQYNAPPQPPNFLPPSGGGMINELERATNIDLNHDGRIGGQSNYPPSYNSFGGPPQPPNLYPPNGANNGMINELERATNIDLNGDGRIGGQSPYPPNYHQPMGPSYPLPYNPYNGPPQPPGSGLINEFEKATNIDINGDGRIGGQSPYFSNSHQPSGPSYPLPYNPYNGPPQPPGSGLLNELEKATNIDLNGDGRIGGQTPYFPSSNPYGYRP